MIKYFGSLALLILFLMPFQAKAQDSDLATLKKTNRATLDKKVKQYKDIQKQIAQGKKTEKDLQPAYQKIEELVGTRMGRVYSGDALMIIFKAAEKDLKNKKHGSCIEKLSIFQPRYAISCAQDLHGRLNTRAACVLNAGAGRADGGADCGGR